VFLAEFNATLKTEAIGMAKITQLSLSVQVVRALLLYPVSAC
jgi:hypothetical protein